MEINIKPEDIDVYVKEAIIKSSIGKIINDSSKKYMSEYLCMSHNSPIKIMLSEVVKSILEQEMNKPENMKIIIEQFNEQFNKEIVTEIIRKVIGSIRVHLPNNY